jgi:tetratricopeptide (TPR) repeat protein
MGMYVHSIKPIEKALKLNSKEPELYLWEGKIFMRNENFSDAEKYFVQFIEKSEEVNPGDYIKIAKTYLKTGKIKKAIEYFYNAIKLDPQNSEAIDGRMAVKKIVQS